MSRYIDADALIERNKEFADCEFIHAKYQATLREVVDEETTVDAVKVVRCENCFYGKPYNEVWYQPKRNSMWCTRDGTEHEYGWFCAGGERREVSE